MGPGASNLHGAAAAAEELEDLVESSGLVGAQLDSDVVSTTRGGAPHLRHTLWTQDVGAASSCKQTPQL